ncbi:MAG: hypothetical protein HYZ53_16495 [Planctomycetes bacterium]|nr:hypothetical protein [Planctomycetota bacterium]
MGTTMAEYLIRKGRALGKAEAKAEGVLRVLERRVGAVPKALRARVVRVDDLAVLDRLLDWALAAPTLKAFAARA